MRDHDRTRTAGTGTGRAPTRKADDTATALPRSLLALQASAGNAAVVRMLHRSGHPGAVGPHEHDAGREEPPPEVQRSAVHDVLRAPGRPLDEATRTDMETRLGADFSDVRIHDDADARDSAAEVGARAYTSGRHVVIGEGGADPRTLAHELTHVIQQRRGAVAGTSDGHGLRISDPSDRFEREADATARRALARPLTAIGPGAARGGLPVRAGAPTAVQRIVTISPDMYLRGVEGNVATNLVDKLRTYLAFAVQDEVTRAVNLNSDGRQFVTELKELVKELNKAEVDGPGVLDRIRDLVRNLNGFLRQHETDTGISVSNSDSRYATEPNALTTGYHHTPTAKDRKEPYWGDDTTMREKLAADLGKVLPRTGQQQPRLDRHKRGGENLPLTQITFTQATKILPRPLINLIFDVRYQLETPNEGEEQPVVDERTENQKSNRDRSPAQGGSLRSWHQDEYGRLPDNGFDPGTVPENAGALHDHYSRHSQSGAGSSVQDAVTSPQGFAEYTGTGSSWEHNTKVVLDYVNKRVYLTVTHYQYWALVPKDGSYTFWQGPGQKLEEAQGDLERTEGGDKAIMMSPWLEITFP